jgi:hypothetical protein
MRFLEAYIYRYKKDKNSNRKPLRNLPENKTKKQSKAIYAIW